MNTSPRPTIVPFLVLLGAVSAVVTVRGARADGIPSTPLAFGGELIERGVPVDGTRNIAVRLWAAATGGAPICPDADRPGTPVAAGRWQVTLSPECGAAFAREATTYSEVVVDGVSFGRQPVGAVPYAVESARAAGASGPLAARLAALDARSSARQFEVGPTAIFAQEPAPDLQTSPWSAVAAGPSVAFTARATGLYRMRTQVLLYAGERSLTASYPRTRVVARAGTPTWRWQPVTRLESPAANIRATMTVEALASLVAGEAYTFGLEASGNPGIYAPEGGAVMTAEQVE